MTAFPVTVKPTYEGWVQWVYSIMGVPSAWLPNDSPYLFYAYNTAYAIVNPVFQCVPGPIFLQMIYNLAAHMLVTWAADPDPYPNGEPYIIVDDVPYGYFQYIRKQNNILGFTTGVVTSSSDEGTSVSLLVPEAFKNLTVDQLALTTTVWGRTYLGYAQRWNGPWGLS